MSHEHQAVPTDESSIAEQINWSVMSPDQSRLLEAGIRADAVSVPRGFGTRTLACGCGYSGRPEAVVHCAEHDGLPGERDMVFCPQCGDA
jgi:hypothetical protein